MRIINCLGCGKEIRNAMTSRKYCNKCRKRKYQDNKNSWRNNRREETNRDARRYYHKNKKEITKKQL